MLSNIGECSGRKKSQVLSHNKIIMGFTSHTDYYFVLFTLHVHV